MVMNLLIIDHLSSNLLNHFRKSHFQMLVKFILSFLSDLLVALLYLYIFLLIYQYCGPTPESNWVIPGVLLVGAYPASQDDVETFELITSILLQGVRKFVCLQQEVNEIFSDIVLHNVGFKLMKLCFFLIII